MLWRSTAIMPISHMKKLRHKKMLSKATPEPDLLTTKLPERIHISTVPQLNFSSSILLTIYLYSSSNPTESSDTWKRIFFFFFTQSLTLLLAPGDTEFCFHKPQVPSCSLWLISSPPVFQSCYYSSSSNKITYVKVLWTLEKVIWNGNFPALSFPQIILKCWEGRKSLLVLPNHLCQKSDFPKISSRL